MGEINIGFLRKLGVFGYDKAEPIVLAALVSGDPLLLVGKAGTGKTFLLNSLSEALGLEHRHYNASLIAFDDLVGFPWPEKSGEGIKYLETPATVWQAESVLVDEINRCKPEHQNRLFSLVHERRIQGLRLEKLRYRWAAMNPPGFDQDGEGYTGCEPLDAALADRFAFIVEVDDWSDMTEADQRDIADPRGEGIITPHNEELAKFVEEATRQFNQLKRNPPEIILEYSRRVGTLLGEAGIRFSPRRVRQLARNLLALSTTCRWPKEQLFLAGLQWSIPQRAGLAKIDHSVVVAAHRAAWEISCSDREDKWLHEFHLRKGVEQKISFLLDHSQCPDTGTLAVAQFLSTAKKIDAAIFSLSLYPTLCDNPGLTVGEEGIQDLGTIAQAVCHVDKELTWRDGSKMPYRKPGGGDYEGRHKNFSAVERTVRQLKGRRRVRAKQLLYYLLAEEALPEDLSELEETFHQCILRVRRRHAAKHA